MFQNILMGGGAIFDKFIYFLGILKSKMLNCFFLCKVLITKNFGYKMYEICNSKYKSVHLILNTFSFPSGLQMMLPCK